MPLPWLTDSCQGKLQESNRRSEQPQDTLLQVPGDYDGRRRHSMAGPVFDRKLNTKFLSEGFEVN